MDKVSEGMNRRQVLQVLGLSAVAGVVLLRPALAGAAATDGTPLQFMPKTAPDPAPLENELAKYPKCPYCGMDRRQWQHSRHLIHYEDELVDATCSLRCASLSLALNIDRGPKAIYAADFGAADEIKPLVEVEQASYLIGSDLPATMSRTSKMAFASAEAAQAAAREHGGEIGDFDAALRQAYLDQAEDAVMIRQRRAARRRRQVNGHHHGH
ncbi:nitrous oxide reductase accessory protein NosL [Desulfurivibrio sp. C05AmB]|uniref:nitrous oxide reductase accessory protein NosL n=1 Tax=Desulfurivibrio sp. C05AmB TaxID=3374371 RepID=UPI00376F29F0